MNRIGLIFYLINLVCSWSQLLMHGGQFVGPQFSVGDDCCCYVQFNPWLFEVFYSNHVLLWLSYTLHTYIFFLIISSLINLLVELFGGSFYCISQWDMKQSRFVILVKAIVYATGFGEWIGVQSFIICGECNFCVHDAISRPPQINCQVMIKYSVFL